MTWTPSEVQTNKILNLNNMKESSNIFESEWNSVVDANIKSPQKEQRITKL